MGECLGRDGERSRCESWGGELFAFVADRNGVFEFGRLYWNMKGGRYEHKDRRYENEGKIWKQKECPADQCYMQLDGGCLTR